MRAGLSSHRLSTKSPSLSLFLTPSFTSFASFLRLFALLLSRLLFCRQTLRRLSHVSFISAFRGDGALMSTLFEHQRGGRTTVMVIITQYHLCASACSPVCTAQALMRFQGQRLKLQHLLPDVYGLKLYCTSQ